MFNLNEIWEHLKVPGMTEKLRALGDILQYALPWLALIISIVTAPPVISAIVLVGSTLYWIVATLLPAIVVTVLKKLFNYTRFGTRPNGEQNSFPSAHTSGAFSGFWFLLFSGLGNVITLPLFFGLAFLTGVSRVLSRASRWHDVIAGALISGVLVYLVLHSQLPLLLLYFLMK